MENIELIKNGIYDSVRLTKKTYTVRGFICKDKSNITLKCTEKNILKIVNFIKSFNSSLININPNKYSLTYNKSKNLYLLDIDYKILINISPDNENRIVINSINISNDLIK